MNGMFETTAYHKNYAQTAATNIRWKQFFISRDKPNKEQWLGDGVYFWERKEDAVWWPGDTVLSAFLSCELDQFVNLDNLEERNSFILFCKELKSIMEHSDYTFDFTDGRFQVNSFFFNNFKEMNDIMLLKYSFPRINNKPQYCATNNSIISDIRIIAKTVSGKLEWSE